MSRSREEGTSGMRLHTINYKKQDGHEKTGVLVDRGFWVRVPRVIVRCRLFGHKPVVDGAGRYRWVACDRCGIRTDPQGPIDEDLVVGQPYTGMLPGLWPVKPSGKIGGQFVVGRSFGGGSVQVSLGCAGDEHVVAASVRLSPLGALYLHAEQHGTWLQRRLNNVGYNSREIGVSVDDGHLNWKLWAKENEWSSDDPKWQQGSIRIDPRDILFGDKRYSYKNVGEKVTATIRMPHGDDHEVTLQLQRQFLGRKRGRRTASWIVAWESENGIPVRFDDGWKGPSFYSSAVDVSETAVENGGWPHAASAAIADSLMRDRVRYNWKLEPAANS